jgi:putative heme transporter
VSRPPVRVVDLDWRTLAAALGTFAGLIIVTGFIGAVPRTVTAVAVGTIIALGLNPLVGLVERRLSVTRGGGVAVVLVGFVLAIVAIGLLLVPPAVRQGRDLGRDLPQVVADLEDLPVIGERLAAAGVPARVERFVEELPRRLGGEDTPLPRIGRSAFGGLTLAGLTILLAITLLLDGERLLRAGGRLVPARHLPRAERLVDLSYRVVGKYVAGSLTVALVAGIVVLVMGLVMGVPLAPLAALWVCMWNLVPQIGGAMGGIPFVLLALTQGATVGLVCGVFFLVYMQIENNVLGPLLVGQAVKLSPPATMTAALVGVSAGGVVGALLAVPLLGAAKAVYLELRPVPTAQT